MTPEEFKNLKIGDMVIHKESGGIYTVRSNDDEGGGRACITGDLMMISRDPGEWKLSAGTLLERALKTSPDQAEKPLTRNQRIIQELRSGASRKGKFVVSWESGHGVSGSLDHADEDRARETFARIVLCSVVGTRVSWVEDGAVVARCVVEDL